MKINQKLYKEYTAKHAPKSSAMKNFFLAYLVGGAICVVGQVLRELMAPWIEKESTLSCAVSVALILLSCLFTAIGWYDRLAKHAGAGTLVPITGFANATISPALDNKAEGFILGVGAKMFTIAGPVIVYGVSASVVYGMIYWITTLF